MYTILVVVKCFTLKYWNDKTKKNYLGTTCHLSNANNKQILSLSPIYLFYNSYIFTFNLAYLHIMILIHSFSWNHCMQQHIQHYIYCTTSETKLPISIRILYIHWTLVQRKSCLFYFIGFRIYELITLAWVQ